MGNTLRSKETGKFIRVTTLANNKKWLYQKFVVERLSWKDFYIKYKISHTLLQLRLEEFGIKRKRTSWCKDTKGIMKPNKTSFKKGHNKGCRFGRDRDISGPNHPNWKGGITPEYIKERMSPEMKAFRIKIMERDNYTCQECGQFGGNLCVHHIKSFAFFPELKYEQDNCITLCNECHKNTDNYLGKAKMMVFHIMEQVT